jgi:hypothetical protein
MTSTISAEAISPLRRRMIEDMSVRKFGEKTQHDYIRHVEAFAKFLGRSPDTATGEDLRRYQVHQAETGVQPPSMNSSAVALRFFFTVTLGRANLATQLTRVRYARRLPRVLSLEDVARLIEAAPGPGLKYKAALSVARGAGLRASEVVSLKVSDIDSKRMLIWVEQGKGRKDRHAMLSPQLLAVLRAWWLQCRSQGWLFPGRDPFLPITTRQLNEPAVPRHNERSVSFYPNRSGLVFSNLHGRVASSNSSKIVSVSVDITPVGGIPLQGVWRAKHKVAVVHNHIFADYSQTFRTISLDAVTSIGVSHGTYDVQFCKPLAGRCGCNKTGQEVVRRHAFRHRDTDKKRSVADDTKTMSAVVVHLHAIEHDGQNPRAGRLDINSVAAVIGHEGVRKREGPPRP